jgi:hypothetical protein
LRKGHVVALARRAAVRYNAGREVDAAARLIPAADLVIRRAR